MSSVQVREVRCDCCDTPTLLPVSSLERIAGDRSGSSTNEAPIFFACLHCSTVAQPDIAAQLAVQTIADGERYPGGRAPFSVLLECAQKGCASRIAVFGTTTAADMNDLQEQRPWHTWKFGQEVQCANRHPPLVPAQVAALWMDM